MSRWLCVSLGVVGVNGGSRTFVFLMVDCPFKHRSPIRHSSNEFLRACERVRNGTQGSKKEGAADEVDPEEKPPIAGALGHDTKQTKTEASSSVPRTPAEDPEAPSDAHEAVAPPAPAPAAEPASVDIKKVIVRLQCRPLPIIPVLEDGGLFFS